METSEYLATVEALHEEARRRGLFFLTASDNELAGRTVTIADQKVVSFSSCSYLGLERHPHLIAGVHDAVDRYGTQFSSSRGYLSAPPYAKLESLLSELFGGHALVTSSTTLGHQVALGVLATEKDAIVMDHQVHHSVHMAATLARAGGTHVEIVKHGELEKAEEVVGRLAQKCKTVWFAIDGVFSMYGDMAPIGLLKRILAVAPNVRLYVDDAHGMSWAGDNGKGSFLSRMPFSERMVVATSLNKAFSAAGGCLVFPTAKERDRVRMCGGPMVFSGPVQPPMLGAAIASAEVHLSSEIKTLQAALAERTSLANKMLTGAGLPLLVENESPIFFVRTGLPRAAFRIAERCLADGYYVNVSTYPSVPMKRAGIRLTLTAAHELADVAGIIERLAVHVPAVMAEENVTMQDLTDQFAKALPQDLASPSSATVSRKAALLELAGVSSTAENDGERKRRDSGVDLVPSAELVVEQYRSIHEVDQALWDTCLGSAGACSWDAMVMAEEVFNKQAKPEHNWQFLYVIVKDLQNKPIAVTFFTTSLAKDDFLMRDEVSRAVEERRKADPYFLTSTVVAMGSMLSEGNHLYLDKSGPWQDALANVVRVATAEYERTQASVLLFRDLAADDPEMDAFLLDSGLVKVPMLDSHVLPITWKDEAGHQALVSPRKRKHLREISAASKSFVTEVHGFGAASLSKSEIETLFDLYRNVASRKLRLNVFALPENLLTAVAESPAWEIVTLKLPVKEGGPAEGTPVAWFAAHKHGGHYAPFFCGLDYRFVFSKGAYRQMLNAIVQRAHALGMTTVHLGMDADLEKARFGASSQSNVAYVEARDHYNGQILREIVAEVGVAPRQRAAAR